MVEVTIDLSELEIQMLVNCIESALDTKHIKENDINRIQNIRNQLNKFL